MVIARCAATITVFDRAAPPFDDEHAAVNPVNPLPLLPFTAYATRNWPAAGRVTPVTDGACGAPSTVAADTADHFPTPTALNARTLHAYNFPVVAPDTTTGEPAPVPIRATPPFDDEHDA